MQLHCEVHDVSRTFASTFEGFISKHVTGMISCALSLRMSGMLATFRQALAEEVAERLVILQGHPPLEAVAPPQPCLHHNDHLKRQEHAADDGAGDVDEWRLAPTRDTALHH